MFNFFQELGTTVKNTYLLLLPFCTDVSGRNFHFDFNFFRFTKQFLSFSHPYLNIKLVYLLASDILIWTLIVMYYIIYW